MDDGRRLRFDVSGLEGAFDLANQLGLALTSAERPIEMLVVRKVE
jgi:hypothetical protein